MHLYLAQELEKHVMNELWAHPTLCSSTLPCEFSSHPHPVCRCSILLPGLCFSHNSEIQKILKEKTWELWHWFNWYQRWHEHSFVLQKPKCSGWSVFRPHSMWAVFLCDLKNLIPKLKWAQKFLKGERWICISESITNGKKNICN